MELNDAHLPVKLVSAGPTHPMVSTGDDGPGTVTAPTHGTSTGGLS